MTIRYLTVNTIMILILSACVHHAQISRKSITYNKSFFNCEYDEINNKYVLTDYPQGVRRLFPVVKGYNFNAQKNEVKINGQLLYPTLNAGFYPTIAQSRIMYASSISERKLSIDKERLLGLTDSIGKFSLTIANPTSRFFVIFMKDSLFPAVIEFKIR